MTVSPGYAWEIQTPEGGWGMESMLCSRAYALNGVLNGIDTQDWNPSTDKHIAKNYSISNFSRGKVSFGKLPDSECRKALGMEGRRAPRGSRRYSPWQVYFPEQHGCYEGTECLQAENKAALQKELSLAERPEVPLIGFIGRLDYQKGRRPGAGSSTLAHGAGCAAGLLRHRRCQPRGELWLRHHRNIMCTCQVQSATCKASFHRRLQAGIALKM